jgi:hypothetical protein
LMKMKRSNNFDSMKKMMKRKMMRIFELNNGSELILEVKYHYAINIFIVIVWTDLNLTVKLQKFMKMQRSNNFDSTKKMMKRKMMRIWIKQWIWTDFRNKISLCNQYIYCHCMIYFNFVHLSNIYCCGCGFNELLNKLWMHLLLPRN